MSDAFWTFMNAPTSSQCDSLASNPTRKPGKHRDPEMEAARQAVELAEQDAKLALETLEDAEEAAEAASKCVLQAHSETNEKIAMRTEAIRAVELAEREEAKARAESQAKHKAKEAAAQALLKAESKVTTLKAEMRAIIRSARTGGC